MKNNIARFVLFSLVFLFSSHLLQAQTNVVINGSFENGSSPWTIQYLGFPAGTIGPSFSGNAPDGSNYLYFGRASGQVSQGFSVESGVTYMLTFSAIAFDGANQLTVGLNYALPPVQYNCVFTNIMPVSQGNGPFNTNWQTFAYTFQSAFIGYAEVRFTYLVDMAYVGPPLDQQFYGSGGIDNVTVIRVVPEPGTVGLLMLGALGLLAARLSVKSAIRIPAEIKQGRK